MALMQTAASKVPWVAKAICMVPSFTFRNTAVKLAFMASMRLKAIAQGHHSEKWILIDCLCVCTYRTTQLPGKLTLSSEK